MSWNSGPAQDEEPGFLMPNLGGGGLAEIPAVGFLGEAGGGFPGGGFPAGMTGGGVVSAIADGGGSPAKSVTINLGSLVGHLSFGSYDGDRDRMQRDLESALIRVLQTANSAM